MRETTNKHRHVSVSGSATAVVTAAHASHAAGPVAGRRRQQRGASREGDAAVDGTAALLRVDFLWDGSHVGAALFAEHVLGAGPIAVVEVPGKAPSAADVAARFVARVENGTELSLEVLRIERRGAEQQLTTVVGFLTQRSSAALARGEGGVARRLWRAFT